MPLAPGDSLVLYTDGVTDATGADDRFGNDRLVSLLSSVNGAGADDLASSIDDALRSFEVGAQRDDVALLVLRAGGADVPLAGAGALSGIRTAGRPPRP